MSLPAQLVGDTVSRLIRIRGLLPDLPDALWFVPEALIDRLFPGFW
jgi:hypothetical protein